MAPAKKTLPDDSSSSSKAQPGLSAKAIGKKPANTSSNGTSKDTARDNGQEKDPPSQKVHRLTPLLWRLEEVPTLQSYRFAHRLTSPSPFSTSLHHAVLTNPGIGRHSPTSVAMKRRGRNKTSKLELAIEIRKHFNAMPADQNAVSASMIYKVHTQDQAFRLRNSPKKVSES